MEVTLDLSMSENLHFSGKGAIVKKTVKTNEMEFMMHAQPGYGSSNKVLNHSGKELPGK